MKRYITLVILVAALTLSFCGCKQKTEYNAFVCDFSDSVPEIEPKLEYTKWSNDYFIDEKQQDSVNLKLKDLTYEGKYLKSEIAFGTNEQRNLYMDVNNHVFEINSQGKLIAYFWGESEDAGTGAIKTAEECEKIAMDFILKASDVDISVYRKDVSYDSVQELYNIKFTKYANDIPTEDRIEISVEKSGHLYSYRATMAGEINVNDIPAFSMEKINEVILNKLNGISKTAKEKYDTVEYNNFQYIISETGASEYALMVTVDIDCKKEYGNYCTVVSERIQLLVPLNS